MPDESGRELQTITTSFIESQYYCSSITHRKITNVDYTRPPSPNGPFNLKSTDLLDIGYLYITADALRSGEHIRLILNEIPQDGIRPKDEVLLSFKSGLVNSPQDGNFRFSTFKNGQDLHLFLEDTNKNGSVEYVFKNHFRSGFEGIEVLTLQDIGIKLDLTRYNKELERTEKIPIEQLQAQLAATKGSHFYTIAEIARNPLEPKPPTVGVSPEILAQNIKK